MKCLRLIVRYHGKNQEQPRLIPSTHFPFRPSDGFKAKFQAEETEAGEVVVGRRRSKRLQQSQKVSRQIRTRSTGAMVQTLQEEEEMHPISTRRRRRRRRR